MAVKVGCSSYPDSLPVPSSIMTRIMIMMNNRSTVARMPLTRAVLRPGRGESGTRSRRHRDSPAPADPPSDSPPSLFIRVVDSESEPEVTSRGIIIAATAG